MNDGKTKQLTSCALFAALVFGATLTGAMAPIGGGAYIHIGDAMIYLAALLLPTPYAVASAAVGAALADFTLGSTIYIIPTIIVKSLVVLAAKGLMKLTEKPVIQDILICLSGIVTVVGYYIAEIILLVISGSSFSAALGSAAVSSVMFNVLQAGASAVIYLIVGGAVRNIVNKRKLTGSAEKEKDNDDK